MIAEPTSREEVAAWVARETELHDRFRHVYLASERHREQHGSGCTVYPTGSGPLLGVIAAATGARRVLELGCGLGYSSLWLAYGAGGGARVETIEEDPAHVELARRQFQREGCGEQIAVHLGRGADVLPTLAGPYDLVFVDGDPAEYLVDLDHFLRLLRAGGVLLSANLFLAVHDPGLPGLTQAAEYRRRLLEDEGLLTAFVGGLALSLRR